MDAYYVHIPEGKIFVDEDGTLYQGSYDEDHGYVDHPGIKPSGKTLRPYKAITIANNADNSTTISKWNGGVAEVTLSDRTLYKDGDWNTLCLPFAISNFEGTPLEGATVKELLSTSNLAAGVLTLNFSDDLTAIEAGKPYIVKWTTTGADLVNPVFENVIIDETTNEVEFTGGTFRGNYAPLEITDDNRNDILLLSSGNRLAYAKTDRTIANGKAFGACRAYFDIPAGSGAQAARQFTLNFGDDEDTQTTGIIGHTDSTDFTDKADAIYDLQGRKVEKPKNGLYIVNGKKVVIK